MIAFDEALRRVAEMARPLGRERVALGEASGRVLAAPVIAQVDSPAGDCSAMDGYAVREADLPGSLAVVGEAFAGRGFDRALEPGTCVRIFTGAPVPAGADRVAVQEVVERAGNRARVPDCAGEPRYIRTKGSDFGAGETLIAAGGQLNPRALVTAAAADLAQVEVWRRPLISILATGDELAAPGEARLDRGRIPDSASYGVAALAADSGAHVIAIRRLGDDLGAMRQAAAQATGLADLVVVTGGASVGDRDFAKAMFEPLGLDLAFSKVAIKPGKPVWLGRCGGTLVLGLPGNPTSAMVTARLFLVPLIAGLTGRDRTLAWFGIPLAEALPGGGSRETFVRARRTAAGAVPVRNQDSGAQAALAHADLLLRCPPGAAARGPGEVVDALAF